MSETLWTPGRAVHEFARQQPDEVVLICAREDGSEDTLTRREFDRWTSQLAHRLIAQGVSTGDYVAIILPNCIEHIVATLATYKAGGSPMPVSYRMPAAERDALLALGRPRAIFCDDSTLDGNSRTDMKNLNGYPDTLPPDAVPQPTKAVASGGSTGKPKLIVSPGAFAFPPGGNPFAHLLRLQPGDLMYSPGPFYHNGPFLFTQIALFHGGRALINERYHTGRMLELIEKHRPEVLNLVPTMMQRMLREPDIQQRDLSSVRLLWHLAAPCPAWAKQGCIDLFGAENVLELWAATEFTGVTILDGNEWLAHQGSVGKGVMTDIRILDEARRELPPGEVGEIFTCFADAPPQYEYLGASPLEQLEGGYASVGDMGYLDEEGYLYLSDRRVDMIISGGANIFPAEVEAVISSHPLVQDVAVIGLADSDLGRRVHAIIEPRCADKKPEVAELDTLCRDKLASYKVPRAFEIVAQLPRNEAGKIRRLSLREERE